VDNKYTYFYIDVYYNTQNRNNVTTLQCVTVSRKVFFFYAFVKKFVRRVSSTNWSRLLKLLHLSHTFSYFYLICWYSLYSKCIELSNLKSHFWRFTIIRILIENRNVAISSRKLLDKIKWVLKSLIGAQVTHTHTHTVKICWKYVPMFWPKNKKTVCIIFWSKHLIEDGGKKMIMCCCFFYISVSAE